MTWWVWVGELWVVRSWLLLVLPVTTDDNVGVQLDIQAKMFLFTSFNFLVKVLICLTVMKFFITLGMQYKPCKNLHEYCKVCMFFMFYHTRHLQYAFHIQYSKSVYQTFLHNRRQKNMVQGSGFCTDRKLSSYKRQLSKEPSSQKSLRN